MQRKWVVEFDIDFQLCAIGVMKRCRAGRLLVVGGLDEDLYLWPIKSTVPKEEQSIQRMRGGE